GEGASGAGGQRRSAAAAEARDPAAGADYAACFRAADPEPLDQREEAGGALIRAQGPDSLLVIVPAWNEEGAVGEVVRSVRRHMPGVPVLVIDDSSTDSTVWQARQAGAAILALPHHLGLGGCVQAGYKLAYELEFQYVIRVDGDG